MKREEKREFYLLLKSTRESVAGSEVLTVPGVLMKLDRAINYLRERLSDNCWENLAYDSLIEIVRPGIEKIRTYGDRLKPDASLCDVLNSKYFEEVR